MVYPVIHLGHIPIHLSSHNQNAYKYSIAKLHLFEKKQ